MALDEMAKKWKILEDDGYTLIESLVAMAIFVTVVLLLVGAMGNMMFSSRTASVEKAVRLAETEIAGISSSTLFDEERQAGGFLLERRVKKRMTWAEVTVKIYSERHADIPLVALTKVVSVGRESAK